MKMTDGLFLEAFRAAANKYPNIQTGDSIVDNCSMQLVRNPGQFDCLVLPNLYGDILTDLCAGLMGASALRRGRTSAIPARFLRPSTDRRRSMSA